MKHTPLIRSVWIGLRWISVPLLDHLLPLLNRLMRECCGEVFSYLALSRRHFYCFSEVCLEQGTYRSSEMIDSGADIALT